MSLSDFTKHPKVVHSVESARKAVAERPVSDLVDDAGKLYVDLVLEGGGVLGVALVGYTYVLEQAGLRFLGLAGTSAGAINALLLAALNTPGEAKSEALASVLTDMPMASFLDGDDDARDFSAAIAKRERAKASELIWKGAQVFDNLRDELGLHPGRKFEAWLEHVLDGVNIRTLADLEARLAKLPRLKGRVERKDAGDLSRFRSSLAMIAADVTTQTKVTLPQMAELYWSEPQKVNPAHFVRASMSIPFFFVPLRAEACPQDAKAKERWSQHTTYTGPIPQEILFLDGAIISNFPISQFHEHERVPMAPTFGVKLSSARTFRTIESPTTMVGALLDSARFALDQSFLIDNPDYRHLVADIALDESQYHWLDFSLPTQSKVELFVLGAQAAANFLERFDWEGYKELRALKARLRVASKGL